MPESAVEHVILRQNFYWLPGIWFSKCFLGFWQFSIDFLLFFAQTAIFASHTSADRRRHRWTVSLLIHVHEKRAGLNHSGASPFIWLRLDYSISDRIIYQFRKNWYLLEKYGCLVQLWTGRFNNKVKLQTNTIICYTLLWDVQNSLLVLLQILSSWVWKKAYPLLFWRAWLEFADSKEIWK